MADESKVLVRLRLLGAQVFGREADRAGRGLRGFGDDADHARRHLALFDRVRGRIGSGPGLSLGALGLTGAVIGGVYELGRGVRVVASEYTESVKVGAQTNAVIKSTGGAAHVTAKQVGALSTVLSNKTAIDDEQIQRGENMLLTFRHVRNEVGRGNDIFTRATGVLTDMSVAMGVDNTKAAIQLGKALQDPVKGITALRRVGVTFTEGQQKQIATLVKHGRVLGAQKLILRELTREFGGSAAAQATPWEHLVTNVRNLAEAIGYLAGPTVNKGISALATFVAQMNTGRGLGGRVVGVARTVSRAVGSAGGTAVGAVRGVARGAIPALQGRVAPGDIGQTGRIGVTIGRIARQVGATVTQVARQVGPAILQTGKDLIDAFAPAMPFLQNVVVPLLEGVGKGVLVSIVGSVRVAIPIIKLLATGLGFVGRTLAPFRGVIQGVGLVIGLVFAGPILRAIGLLGRLGIVARVLLIPLRLNIAAFRLVGRIVATVASRFAGALSTVSRFGGTMTGVGRRVVLAVTNMAGGVVARIEGIVGKVRGLAGRFLNAGKGIGRSIGRGILGAFTSAVGFAADIGRAIANWLNDHTPFGDKIDLGITSVRIPALAAGGVVRSGGLHLVGEQGPELARFPVGTRVYNARDTARMTSGARRSAMAMAAPAMPSIWIRFQPTLDGRVIHDSVHRIERSLVEAT